VFPIPLLLNLRAGFPAVTPRATAWAKAPAPIASTWTNGHQTVMSSTGMGIVLPPHVRGDTFPYSTALDGGWVASDFTGGMKFTLRRRYPASSVVTDVDADVVDQATTTSGEVVGSGASVAVTIPASRTTGWPAGKLYWDLQAIITGSPNRVYTIASGVITILPDVTRST
jgi:hypothetical protein